MLSDGFKVKVLRNMVLLLLLNAVANVDQLTFFTGSGDVCMNRNIWNSEPILNQTDV